MVGEYKGRKIEEREKKRGRERKSKHITKEGRYPLFASLHNYLLR